MAISTSTTGSLRLRTRGNKLRLTRSVQYGFTLIELLVTITIIAILVGVVTINLDFRNAGKTVRNTALRTGLLMDLASDQAVYARQQFGIRFHPESYGFYVLSTNDSGDESWQPLEDKQLRFVQPDLAMEFEVDISGLPIVLEDLEDELSSATEEDPLKPHVIFLSNGEIFPDFRVVISDSDGDYRYAIETGDEVPVLVEALEGDA
ncbi:MAG: prepilin-type N-terminal cleavage/methylation domain-containing protein [Granulosicoccus sp.]|nr:prepilin-type N-terminal cleavage/methylation domain-containing protein [Granulosicoccus sp.]